MAKIYVKNAANSHMYYEGGVKVAGNNVVEVEETDLIKKALKKGRLDKTDKADFEKAKKANAGKPVDSETSSSNTIVKEVEVEKEVDLTSFIKLVKKGLESGTLKSEKGGWIKLDDLNLGRTEEEAAKKVYSDPSLFEKLADSFSLEKSDS
ncbi:MAG: hypothetical protein CL843_09425 [Crocinitomicaceae bacterium]|nr:hypothetical protein [Crocinitomicaceae bacterium]|tara:strand:- start:169 stop:621 length:453 start_codon:yes stop_codon:yes gene_type:complete